jgi:hypothetical protein
MHGNKVKDTYLKIETEPKLENNRRLKQKERFKKK